MTLLDTDIPGSAGWVAPIVQVGFSVVVAWWLLTRFMPSLLQKVQETQVAATASLAAEQEKNRVLVAEIERRFGDALVRQREDFAKMLDLVTARSTEDRDAFRVALVQQRDAHRDLIDAMGANFLSEIQQIRQQVVGRPGGA